MYPRPNAPQRVLVVEDDRDLGALLLDALDAEGYAVHLTPTGQNAIMRFGVPNHPLPDLILLDYNLPDMPGCDVMQAVQVGERRTSIPVILMTARVDGAALARDMGALYYIIKPFDLRAILALVKSGLTPPRMLDYGRAWR